MGIVLKILYGILLALFLFTVGMGLIVCYNKITFPLNISICGLILVFAGFLIYKMMKYFIGLDELLTTDIPVTLQHRTNIIPRTSASLPVNSSEFYERVVNQTLGRAQRDLDEMQERLISATMRANNRQASTTTSENITRLMKEAREKLEKQTIEEIKKSEEPGEDILVL